MTPAPRLTRRLGSCPRCGDDVILRPGIKAGRAVRLRYDADEKRLHKFTCSATSYPQVKHCPRCDETKPVLDFGLNPARRDGLNPWCRLCRKVYDYQHNEQEKVTA